MTPQKKALRKKDMCDSSELLITFAKSLNYNGIKIFTDYGAKKAVVDFLVK